MKFLIGVIFGFVLGASGIVAAQYLELDDPYSSSHLLIPLNPITSSPNVPDDWPNMPLYEPTRRMPCY